MVLLHEILADSSTYSQFFSRQLWRLLLPKLQCPRHSTAMPCTLIGWGTWKRRPKIPGGDALGEVKIQRFLCTAHRKTFSLLPLFVLPRLHYAAEVVQSCTQRYVQGESINEISRNFHRPDERTLRRWVAYLKAKSQAIRQNVFRFLGQTNHTFDQADYSQQKSALAKSPRPSRLVRLWALLKTTATQLLEHRAPYHYALARSP